ncbi:MAG: hypothetical protein H7039_22035 [Bryobacteraceae bacterium]|nr:hypothetical protein [Bryobacteraceae bacterium]
MEAVLTDFEVSPLSEKDKVMFRLIEKVNSSSWTIQAADMEAVRSAGWDDEAIYYAVTVCALFNFYNRWIDATGVHALSEEAHRLGGTRSANTGYVRK